MRTCFLAMKNDLHKMKRRKTWNMKVELSCCKDDGQLKTQMKRKNTLKKNTTITTLLILSKCLFWKAFAECNVTLGNASCSSILLWSLIVKLLLFLLMSHIWLSIHFNRYSHLFKSHLFFFKIETPNFDILFSRIFPHISLTYKKLLQW